jgi:asparagine synthase (glutamine-hydrolysing)
LSGIFGAVNRDGSPLDRAIFDTLRRETEHWGRDGGGTWCDGVAGFGSALSFCKRDANFDSVPFTGADGCVFTAAGRVDNRDTLAEALGLGSTDLSVLGETALMHRAWLRWGESCAGHVYGDWAFAAWDPAKRRLFLTRDHSGTTSLYYHVSSRFFAFSSSRRALLKLNLAHVEMDELYLAQMLVAWFGYQGERTIHKQVMRLLPAHYLTLTQEDVEVGRYWRLEDTPELVIPRNDYIPAFLEVFDRAVLNHLRGEGPVGATLSGGLDSGAVTVTGAGHLRQERRRIQAFTSVPCFATSAYTNTGWFGDELSCAQATAETVDNIDLVTVDAEGVCPVDAIRRGLRISLEPKHGACNMFWLLELRRMAAERGCRILLTGSRGNETISWTGSFSSQPYSVQIRGLGWRRWLRETVRRQRRRMARPAHRRRRIQHLWSETAIHPDFAERLDLTNRYLDDQDALRAQQALPRTFLPNPGATFLGAAQAEMGAAFGFEIRDPTADARVLAFCYSVPDRIFINPETGLDRWLIREAMKGRLPESVRMNRRRGRQAADLVPRLRNSAAAVEGALAEIEGGPAAGYVSVPAMRKVWQKVQRDDTPEAFRLAGSVLTAGIMAGLFVNGFGTDW